MIKPVVIFYYEDDAAEVNRIRWRLEAHGIEACAVSNADLDVNTPGWVDCTADLSFACAESDFVQCWCLYKGASGKSGDKKGEATAFFEKVSSCIKSRKGPGVGVKPALKGASGEAAEELERYVSTCEDPNTLINDVKIYIAKQDDKNASYKTDKLLTACCKVIIGSGLGCGSGLFNRTIITINNHLLKRAELLTDPYDPKKFSNESAPHLRRLLELFERFDAAKDELRYSAIRVQICHLLARTTFIIKAAKHFLEPDDNREGFNNAVEAFNQLWSGNDIAGAVQADLGFAVCNEYEDLYRAWLDYRRSMDRLIKLKYGNQAHREEYNWEKVIESAKKRRVPDPSLFTAASADEGSAPPDCASGDTKLTELLKDYSSSQYAHLYKLWHAMSAENVGDRTLACFRLFCERIRGFAGEVGDESSKSAIAEIEMNVSKDLLSCGGAAEVSAAENAFRELLGLYARDPRLDRRHYDVFISHRHSGRTDYTDEDELARRLYTCLIRSAEFPCSPFLDRYELEKIGKSYFPQALFGALERSDNMVLLLQSFDDLNSEWVQYEYAYFHGRIQSGEKRDLFLLITDEMERQLSSGEKKLPEALEHNYQREQYDPRNLAKAAEKLCSYLLNKLRQKTESSVETASGDPGKKD